MNENDVFFQLKCNPALHSAALVSLCQWLITGYLHVEVEVVCFAGCDAIPALSTVFVIAFP